MSWCCCCELCKTSTFRNSWTAIYHFLEASFPIYFQGKKRPELDYGALVSVMQQTIDNHGFQPHPWFMGKVVELYEMIVVSHVLDVWSREREGASLIVSSWGKL